MADLRRPRQLRNTCALLLLLRPCFHGSSDSVCVRGISLIEYCSLLRHRLSRASNRANNPLISGFVSAKPCLMSESWASNLASTTRLRASELNQLFAESALGPCEPDALSLATFVDEDMADFVGCSWRMFRLCDHGYCVTMTECLRLGAMRRLRQGGQETAGLQLVFRRLKSTMRGKYQAHG